MQWLQEEIAEMWRVEGKRYVSEINGYVNKGMTEGWNRVGEADRYTRAGNLAPFCWQYNFRISGG